MPSSASAVLTECPSELDLDEVFDFDVVEQYDDGVIHEPALQSRGGTVQLEVLSVGQELQQLTVVRLQGRSNSNWRDIMQQPQQHQQPTLAQYQRPVGREFDEPAHLPQQQAYTNQGNNGLGRHNVAQGHNPMYGGLNEHPVAHQHDNYNNQPQQQQQQQQHQHQHRHVDVNQLKNGVSNVAHGSTPHNTINGLGGGYGAGVAGNLHDGTFGKHDKDYHAEQARKLGDMTSTDNGISNIGNGNSTMNASSTAAVSSASHPTTEPKKTPPADNIDPSTSHQPQQTKPSVMDKVSGTLDVALGKMTKNTEKVELGQAKKEGLLH
ncbi:hypothetical protein OIO90_006226 [Microbotryomycetes sp. JL221]|nr:hypothetical protein OIO90_006226 [Microbotryomycetes sp. JL221]